MKIIFTSILIFWGLFAQAQDVFKVSESWTDLTIWYKIGDQIKIGGDVGYRTTIKDFSFHLGYIRPTIIWKPSPLYNLSFAVSNFYKDISGSINLNELRLAQEANLFWPKIGSFKIDHRLRFEERFYQINNNKANSTRMRYRLGLKSPTFHLFGIGTPFFSELTWEDFKLLGSSFEYYWGNTQRWEVVLGNKISKKVKLGFHYILQTTRTTDKTFSLQENILRIRIGYTIN
ncbi:DUF2490 domain-containing protein [Reichenbachiella carrageenanivorans]|uniref:DUF2490 domain-containing protein n=1 Tax=Reichenbachiella carrageenanivorans TaxID=2979869 RepID=A0ABY6D3Q1_9BACT|nr:DUF2490 domain-containing protein [Reichenbachiella carrageenanivorans]UXX80529.1 DUF2490 domain-containing protein [Reichenbachiella carrageenanivorans]